MRQQVVSVRVEVETVVALPETVEEALAMFEDWEVLAILSEAIRARAATKTRQGARQKLAQD